MSLSTWVQCSFQVYIPRCGKPKSGFIPNTFTSINWSFPVLSISFMYFSQVHIGFFPFLPSSVTGSGMTVVISLSITF